MNIRKKGLFSSLLLWHGISIYTWQQPTISFDHAQRCSSYPYISSDTFRAICNHHIDEAHAEFNPVLKSEDHIIKRG